MTRCSSIFFFYFFLSFFFLVTLNMLLLHGILYCPNLNLSMCFRVGSTSPVTFKTKLSVRTVSKLSAIATFCYKELHLRCWTKYCNIITKILKGIGGHPHDRVKSWENKKNSTHSPRSPKNTFPKVFHIKFFAWIYGIYINSLP